MPRFGRTTPCHKRARVEDRNRTRSTSKGQTNKQRGACDCFTFQLQETRPAYRQETTTTRPISRRLAPSVSPSHLGTHLGPRRFKYARSANQPHHEIRCEAKHRLVREKTYYRGTGCFSHFRLKTIIETTLRKPGAARWSWTLRLTS